MEAARAVLETVLSQSPDNAMALAMMASTTLVPLFAGYASVDQSEVSQATTFADKAVGLDANNDFIFQTRGMVRCMLLKDFAGAASDFKRSLEINPNFLVTRFSLASLSIYSGDPKAAINPLRELLDVSPEDPLIPMVYTLLSAACLLADDDKLALQYARQAHDRAPLMPTCAAIYAAAAAQDREIVGSKAFSSMISRFDLRTTDLEKLPFVRRDDIELFRSRLRIAGARE